MSKRSGDPKLDPKTGTWWFVVDTGTKDGKRTQARRRGFKTKRAAMDELARIRVKVAERTFVAPSRQPFGEYLVEDWLPAIKVEPTTRDSYERLARLHVVPRIGHVQLRDLDAAMLNRFYGELLASGGRKDGKDGGLSPRTVRYLHTIVGKALKDAMRWGRITSNAATFADPPSMKQAKAPEMKTWSGEVLARFLALSGDDRIAPTFLFLATTGTRRGEAVGLRWGDLDLDAGTAAIRQTITVVAGHRILVRPRTKTDRARNIELDARTIAVLRAWRARQNTERLAKGADYQDHDLVFCKPNGEPYNPKHVSREFDRRVRRYGLPRIRLHDLRHTWASLALAAGIPAKVVSERLGHATTAITLDTYSHVTPAMQSGAAEKVANLIFGEQAQ